MEMATSAREEIGLRIETLRSQARHNREEALRLSNGAYDLEECATQCDALADGYAELLSPKVTPTITLYTPLPTR